MLEGRFLAIYTRYFQSKSNPSFIHLSTCVNSRGCEFYDFKKPYLIVRASAHALRKIGCVRSKSVQSVLKSKNVHAGLPTKPYLIG
jgi:hypothetical protein